MKQSLGVSCRSYEEIAQCPLLFLDKNFVLGFVNLEVSAEF
jgi:hypothetical protein